MRSRTVVVEVEGLQHQYRKVPVLRGIDLEIEEGSVYALLGPNGAGKTTLLQILMGLRGAAAGDARVLGRDSRKLTIADKAMIGYVAEGQKLPGWMTLTQLEAYLAPLYPSWDHAFANELRQRFRLDAARKIKTLSRGEAMKAALLCAIAPRPKLLLMDEPFTGMDVVVKDEIVRGVLASAGNEGWTVVLCSHDIGEVEMLADHVGLLDRGRLLVSEPMDQLLGRFRHIDVYSQVPFPTIDASPAWLHVRTTKHHMSFIVQHGDLATERYTLQQSLPSSARIETRPASLREIFVALAETTDGGIVAPEPVR